MAGATAYARARARVERVCAPAEDSRDLRLRLLTEIREVVAFDAHAWLLTDPETSVGTAPLADVPCLPELPRLIRLKYLTEVNRWTALAGAASAPVSAARGPGTVPRTGDWCGFLAGYGVRDVASAVFRDRHGCWGWLDLWRSGATSPFRVEELGFLTEVLTPVTTALRRCQANTFVSRAAGRPHPGALVLVLSPDLDVVGQTPHTHEYLSLMVPPAPGFPPIPANAYNVAAQLLAVEAGVDDNEPRARLHLTDGVWVTLRAARIGADGPAEQRDIAVTIEEAAPGERMAVFARCCGLSPRETELLRHVVTGIDTREVATRMYLSEHTVQDYLKAMFAKTSTHSRRALVSRALGT